MNRVYKLALSRRILRALGRAEAEARRILRAAEAEAREAREAWEAREVGEDWEAWEAWWREEELLLASLAAAEEVARFFNRATWRWRDRVRALQPPLRRRQTRAAAIAAAIAALASSMEELGGSCGGLLHVEEAAEACRDESLRVLKRLLVEEEFKLLLLEFDLEE